LLASCCTLAGAGGCTGARVSTGMGNGCSSGRLRERRHLNGWRR
jgi:hypothetical protein